MDKKLSFHHLILVALLLLICDSTGAQDAREDLDRFAGLYGDPASGRQFFVMPSCEGQLVIGPMWADVAPWWMSSVAELEFTYSDSFTQFEAEFTVSDTGEVEALEHNLEAVESPMKRAGPVSAEFGECVPP
ncbi:MAG: hypothetical protein R3245_02100, partial [Kiloniellales bacterium]|nr:hypothetical protein [Kiloniellales bacterium]